MYYLLAINSEYNTVLKYNNDNTAGWHKSYSAQLAYSAFVTLSYVGESGVV